MTTLYNVIVWDIRDRDSEFPGSDLIERVDLHTAKITLAQYLMSLNGPFIEYAVIENASNPMDYESFSPYGTSEGL